MATLSVCMIVKDECEVLDRILRQAQDFADEIIVVDTGSNDNTKDIAYKYTDKVYDFDWVDDFSLARNYSFNQANCDYIMWLDADDIIQDDVVNRIKTYMKNIQCDTVMCPYYADVSSSGKVNFWYYRERIVRRCEFAKWVGFVHEVIVPFGQIDYKEDIIIQHAKEKVSTGRNLQLYRKHIARGVQLDTRHLYYFARELYYNGALEESLNVLDNFFNRKDGFAPNVMDAYVLASDISAMLGNNLRSEYYLFEALKIGVPSGALCVKLGNLFFNKFAYESAIFWYESALRERQDNKNGAFYDVNLCRITPALQLCVCYYRIGNKARSKRYNDYVLEIDDTNASALYNKQLFVSEKD